MVLRYAVRSSFSIYETTPPNATPSKTSSLSHAIVESVASASDIVASIAVLALNPDLEGDHLAGQHQAVVPQEGGDLLQGQLVEQQRLREGHKVLQHEAAGRVAHGQQAVGGGDVPHVHTRGQVELGQQEVHAHLQQLGDLQGGCGRHRAADGVQRHVHAAQVGEGDDIGQTWGRGGRRAGGVGVNHGEPLRTESLVLVVCIHRMYLTVNVCM